MNTLLRQSGSASTYLQYHIAQQLGHSLRRQKTFSEISALNKTKSLEIWNRNVPGPAEHLYHRALTHENLWMTSKASCVSIPSFPNVFVFGENASNIKEIFHFGSYKMFHLIQNIFFPIHQLFRIISAWVWTKIFFSVSLNHHEAEKSVIWTAAVIITLQSLLLITILLVKVPQKLGTAKYLH